ncbi:MAG: threonine/serine dehydratase [Alphaproteobacteria bacterium]|nr:threonine/serine dehydratase [Alphaproteobacteria bacterium]
MTSLTVASTTDLSDVAPPTVADVEAAASRLKGVARVTPLLESTLLNERLGGRLIVKAEVLQRSGSFKFRGAFNRLSLIPAADRGKGVVAYSSGNHAQGVAYAARLLGIKAWIIMPSDAPRIKMENTRAYGAEVVPYDRYKESREAIGDKLTRDKGATLVRPFDDPGVISGQGTVGLEVAEQMRALGAEAAAVVAPCSGGGLIAGIALALEARSPGTKPYAAEPAGFEDLKHSLAAGRRMENAPGARSFCDALLSAWPGEITFQVHKRLLGGSFAVTDAEVQNAMATAFEYFKIVVEPGGACGLAAVLTGQLPVKGRTVVAVCSGGNVDPGTFSAALSAG